jgi:hypothetical protein
MTDFTKTKISFALALLGTLFALHPFVERHFEWSFNYLGYDLKLIYAFALTAGLLAITVYCYAMALVSERVHGFMERLGNYADAPDDQATEALSGQRTRCHRSYQHRLLRQHGGRHPETGGAQGR